MELSSVFNQPGVTIFTGGSYNEALATEVRQMWVNFAATGDPSTPAHPWPEYREDQQKTMMLGNDIYLKDHLYSRRTAIVEPMLRYEVNGNYAELDYNVPYLRTVIGGAAAVAGVALYLILRKKKK